MTCLAEIAFMPWFTRDEWDLVQAHSAENFRFIKYTDQKDPSKVRSGRLNDVTQEVMWEDPGCVVAVKDIFIAAIVNPIILTGRVSFHLLEGTGLVISNIACSFLSMAKDLWDFEFSKVVFADFRDALVLGTLKEVIKRIKEISRVVFCYIGVEAAAFFGILFSPLKSRKMIQLLERAVNHGDEFHHSEIKLNKNFFAYSCMQPRVYDFKQKLPDSSQPRYTIDPTSKPNVLPDNCCSFLLYALS